jgi:site-specific DNA recombinase
VKGQYPAILDEDTWHQIVHLLTGSGRPPGHAYASIRKRLLSGIIRCGNCGKKLSSNAQPNNQFKYSCRMPYADGGCGKVCGSGVPIDQLVTQLVLAYFAEQAVEQEAPTWSGAVELETLRERKTHLIAQFTENPDMGQYIWPKIREIDIKIDTLIQDRAMYGRRRSKTKSTTVTEQWGGLDVTQQRAIVEEVIEAVVLAPAARPSNRFDTSRVTVIWRGE